MALSTHTVPHTQSIIHHSHSAEAIEEISKVTQLLCDRIVNEVIMIFVFKSIIVIFVLAQEDKAEILELQQWFKNEVLLEPGRVSISNYKS